ncbi:hypothetical protein D3C78_1629750 [compost metagenome]
MQDDVSANRRVGLHDFPVLAFQAIRRKQHAIRRSDLAHIMQPGGHGGGLLFVFGQTTGLRQRHAQGDHTAAMSAGGGVTRLHGGEQRGLAGTCFVFGYVGRHQERRGACTARRTCIGKSQF